MEPYSRRFGYFLISRTGFSLFASGDATGAIYSLIHVLATIDRDVGAGDERRLLRAKVDDQAGDFVGLAEPAERDLRQDFGVEDFLRDRGHHLGADVAGRDGVDGHA